jgi:peptidoglycan/LPS O-acetylase OafA/YrhL
MPGRLHTLTGMRFLAALPIVFLHVGSNFFGLSTLRAAFGYGYIGVSFFFVLSGFVLTWSTSDMPARRFWWLRFARIWPAQALVAAMVFVFLIQDRPPDWPGRAADFLLVQSWWPSSDVYFGGNGVSWSLSCEAFFYLAFPALVIGIRRLDHRGLAVVGAGLLAMLAIAPAVGEWLGLSQQVMYWLFFILPAYRLLEFLLGMILARAVQCGFRVPHPRVAAVVSGTVLAGLVAFLVWATSNFGWYPSRPWVALLFLPVFASLVLAGATADIVGAASWLTSRPLQWLGATSFGLYLVHQPLFRITQSWGWWPTRHDLVGVLAFAAFLAVAVAVAGLLHHLVEKPLERRLRAIPVGLRTMAYPTAAPRRLAA